jgi:hypothetical protein
MGEAHACTAHLYTGRHIKEAVLQDLASASGIVIATATHNDDSKPLKSRVQIHGK